MDGLLGRKDQEDQYIKALLLIDGITSVTIDRVRASGGRKKVRCAARRRPFSRNPRPSFPSLPSFRPPSLPADSLRRDRLHL